MNAASHAETRTAYRTCPLCEATCGLAISVRDGRVLRVRGDRDDVLSGGYLCPKGVALGELHDDPDRLRRPLVRRDGRLQEASWEEAWARVSEGLAPWLAARERTGIGVYVGNPTVHNLAGSLFLRPLLKALNTRQLFTASTVDQIPKHVASGLMFGDPFALPVPDIDRTDYLLLLGANPWESNGSLWTAPDLPGRIRRLRRRGGRFVVVDPRRTRTAEHADLHLAIRPGCDAHWMLALAQVIVSEGRAAPAAWPRSPTASIRSQRGSPRSRPKRSPRAVTSMPRRRDGSHANSSRRHVRRSTRASAAMPTGTARLPPGPPSCSTSLPAISIARAA